VHKIRSATIVRTTYLFEGFELNEQRNVRNVTYRILCRIEKA